MPEIFYELVIKSTCISIKMDANAISEGKLGKNQEKEKSENNFLSKNRCEKRAFIIYNTFMGLVSSFQLL